MYIDWRGRLYTFSTLLSYQGKSIAKSLINVNNANLPIQPLNKEGLKGFRIYIAGISGLSLASNDSKLSWFKENEERIIAFDSNLINNANDSIEM
jgi:DNA-directed RNA polymerase